MYVYVSCAHLGVYVWRPEVNFGTLLPLLFLQVFEIGSFPEPGVHPFRKGWLYKDPQGLPISLLPMPRYRE